MTFSKENNAGVDTALDTFLKQKLLKSAINVIKLKNILRETI